MQEKRKYIFLQRLICELRMLTATLFIIIKSWKQPKCPSIRTRKKKSFVVYPYNIILLNNKKERTHNNVDEFQNNYAEFKKLDTLLPTEQSTYYMSPFTENSQKYKQILSVRKRSMVTWG